MSGNVVYALAPASEQAERIAVAVMVGLIVAASATAVWTWRWRGAAVAALAAALVPAATVIAANGFRAPISLWVFIRDAAAPLSATIGAACAVIGVLIGVVMRRAAGRRPG